MARLAFSFIIIAGFLLWQAFEVNREPSTISPRVRFGLYLLGALCSDLQAGIGFRVRHRREKRRTS